MVAEILRLAPPWMIAGVLLGAAATLTAAGIFYLGDRYLPSTGGAAGSRILGSVRRRTEIRRYLRSIDEPFTEDHAIGGDEVAFYLPNRDVAITFDAKQFFRLEPAGPYTVLYEDEMPSHHLGRRLPFEVPKTDPPSGSPEADPIAAAFDELRLPKTADEDEVRTAYRERVKEVHPDQGGDEEAFQRLQEAYATAKNYCTRRRKATARDGDRPEET